MCYTIPGKVVELKGGKAKVQYGDEMREADASLVDVKPGEYVIVQAKFVVSTVPEKEAKEALALWDETERLPNKCF